MIPPRSGRRRRRPWRSRCKTTFATLGLFALIIVFAIGFAAPELLDDCDGHYEFESNSPCAAPLFDFHDWIEADR